MSIRRFFQIRLMVGALSVLFVATSVSAQVTTSAARQTFLDNARELLAKRDVADAPKDPFHSEAFNEMLGLVERPLPPTASGGVVAPRNNRELLQAIAEGLKPSGYFMLGNEHTLVFGQKRVKAGGLLTINFEGNEYTLEITSVTRTHFTIRLNRDEFTRPIR